MSEPDFDVPEGYELTGVVEGTLEPAPLWRRLLLAQRVVVRCFGEHPGDDVWVTYATDMHAAVHLLSEHGWDAHSCGHPECRARSRAVARLTDMGPVQRTPLDDRL